MRRAAWEWNHADRHTLTLRYWGDTTRTMAHDGYNVLFWGSSSAIITLYMWSTGSDITEFDIAFSSSLTWNTNMVCPNPEFDVWNTAVHAFGQAIGFNILYGDEDDLKSMYRLLFTGEVRKRTLKSEDRQGIRRVY